MSLREVSQRTVDLDPDKKGVSAAQIGRIETDRIKPDTRELVLICKALDLQPAALFRSNQPWFVVRADKARARLEEVLKGRYQVQRSEAAHRNMIDKGIYNYVPLEPPNVEVEHPDVPGQAPDALTSEFSMRSYLFSVGRVEDENLTLDHLDGEEIVYVLKGELEFRYVQPDGQPRSITLRPGDTLHYSSLLNHAFRATGTGDRALALFVYTHSHEATRALIRLLKRDKARDEPSGLPPIRKSGGPR
jgi:transcriptional regulator with XRE-family HTH domain